MSRIPFGPAPEPTARLIASDTRGRPARYIGYANEWAIASKSVAA
jgi:hypothetical protein